MNIVPFAPHIESIPILPSSKSLKKRLLSISSRGGGVLIIGHDKKQNRLIPMGDFYCQQILAECELDHLINSSGYMEVEGINIFQIQVRDTTCICD